jgi:hypothetical protein
MFSMYPLAVPPWTRKSASYETNAWALTFFDPFSLTLIDPPVGARQQLFLPQVRDLFAFNCPSPVVIGVIESKKISVFRVNKYHFEWVN